MNTGEKDIDKLKALANPIRPPYYKSGPYEVYRVINEWNLNFNRGTVIKYIVRAGEKDTLKAIEDLKKAKQYIDFEIERIENNDPSRTS